MTAAETYQPPGLQPLNRMRAWPAKPLAEGARIIAAAILRDGQIHYCIRPCRHHHVLFHIGGNEPGDVQGFLASDGQFLDRKQARALAIENGQCRHPANPSQLFSEDLW